MSASKRARLEVPATDFNGGLENGYHDGIKNGMKAVAEDDYKAGGGLSKTEIMRLRSEHIG